MVWRLFAEHPFAFAPVLKRMAALLLCWAPFAWADTAPTDRATWLAQLAWPTKLCPAASPLPQASGVDVLPIDSSRSWVRVRCELSAYQGSDLLFLRTAGKTVLLSFVQFDAEQEGVLKRYRSPVLEGSLSFDAKRQTLTVLRLYRGIGDCGQRLEYAAGSAVPRLLSLRVRDCPDTPDPALLPNQWPLKRLSRTRPRYRSKVWHGH